MGDVAAWAQEHGDQLLSRNIRRSLGLTQVNQSLVETLTTDPQMFFYFNNGITVLCDELKAVPFSRSAPHGAVSLQLRGASVVNGAQTVSAVAEAMITNPEVAANAMVNVRVIVTGARMSHFPTRSPRQTTLRITWRGGTTSPLTRCRPHPGRLPSDSAEDVRDQAGRTRSGAGRGLFGGSGRDRAGLRASQH